ncbi:MAG: phosphomannomutase/phosphoglucomutase, partial [Firmicutes bacterium]|nr:phosphomannomutase/phosphoglucomutase [Bacillota bacterium]
MTERWKHLKSGTDIRGVASEDGIAAVTLTRNVGISVGSAFVRWLSERLDKPAEALRVAVGRDSR